MVSHAVETPLYGTPLVTDKVDGCLVSRQHEGNHAPLKRYYRDTRKSILNTLIYKRTWGVMYDVSDAFFYVRPGATMCTIVALS